MCPLGYNISQLQRGFAMNNNEFINTLSSIISNDKNFEFLYNNMSTFQKRIFAEMKDNPDVLKNYSLNQLLYDFDSEFVSYLLDIEIDLQLKESLDNGVFNKRNGYTKNIDLSTPDGKITFNRPRLRNEKGFDSAFIPKRTKHLDNLKDNILLLYAKNNSVNDIKEIIKAMFNINVSTGFISNVSQTVYDQVLSWRNRQLDEVYLSLNIDCTYITIRDNKSLKSHDIPIYIAIGTNLKGHKEIVGLYLGNEDAKKNIIDSLYETDICESKTFWLDVFYDLKERGLKQTLFIVSDGVTGIKDAINDEFPDAFYQRCVVHIVRNLKTKISKKDYSAIKDFKKIYSALDKKSALLYWEEFKEKYKNNNVLMKYATKYFDEIIPMMDLPINIRKYIYTNNIVESANSKIKRGFYGRGALPNANSAINIIYLNLIDLEKKWSKTKVNNWDKIFQELQVLYPDLIKKYL